MLSSPVMEPAESYLICLQGGTGLKQLDFDLRDNKG